MGGAKQALLTSDMGGGGSGGSTKQKGASRTIVTLYGHLNTYRNEERETKTDKLTLKL